MIRNAQIRGRVISALDALNDGHVAKGWLDAFMDKPYASDYDMWIQDAQLRYELGRRMAVIYSKINPHGGLESAPSDYRDSLSELHRGLYRFVRDCCEESRV